VPDGVVPFRDVYFTSIIRDATGRKMSKSLGNSPDPIELIERYGADALRFTVCYLAPLGQDVLFSSEKCEIGRNFANKIWNAGRFLLMNRAGLEATGDGAASSSPSSAAGAPSASGAHADLADRWILSRLHTTIGGVRETLDKFDINNTAKIVYDFVWHDFCDWYLEMIKARLYAGGDAPTKEQMAEKAAVLANAFSIFDGALRLLHPYMPFISEELWHATGDRRQGEFLMSSEFPRPDARLIDTKVEKEMAFVQEAINGVRNVRGELSVPPSKEITVLMSGDGTAVLKKYEGYFRRLARVSRIDDAPGGRKPAGAASVIVGKGELYIPLEGLIDLDAERGRLKKELERITGLHEAAKKKLSNTSFIERAPAAVIDQEKKKLESFEDAISKLTKNLEAL
jgi:valyl-tRNA synthetase